MTPEVHIPSIGVFVTAGKISRGLTRHLPGYCPTTRADGFYFRPMPVQL